MELLTVSISNGLSVVLKRALRVQTCTGGQAKGAGTNSGFQNDVGVNPSLDAHGF